MGKRSKSEKFKTKMQTKFKAAKKGAKSNASTNPNRKLTEKQANAPHSHLRTKQSINRMRMYNEKPDYEKMWIQSKDPARIDPNRKWFGNVRTIDQEKLEKLRTELAKRTNDPRSVLIKAKTLPLSLLVEPEKKKSKLNILDIESYNETFGPKSRRKRVKLNSENLNELVEEVTQKDEGYDVRKDEKLDKHKRAIEVKECKDKRLLAGQSKRIWEELYKVVDASDVLCIVIDSRDPLGTRCYHLEQHIKKNCPHKHVVLILNKCDLIPTWLTARWVQFLSKDFPTIAFKSHLNKPFGKGAFINLIRQFDKFHQDKQTMSVGFVGYPNVGKSSVINSMKKRKVCKSAPVPGETRVWQYVALTKRIYLIDCPGVVYVNEGKDEVEVVLKGCVRAEKLEDPTYYIPALLQRVKPEVLIRLYQIENFEDDQEFLKKLAIKKGRLLKGGDPDLLTTAKLVLMDWQRGEIPFFSYPPDYNQNLKEDQNIDEKQIEEMMIKINNEKLHLIELKKEQQQQQQQQQTKMDVQKDFQQQQEEELVEDVDDLI